MEGSSSLAGFVAAHLAAAGLFVVLALALGRRITAWAALPPAARHWGLPLAAGFGALGCAAALLAAAGCFSTPALLVAGGVAIAVAWPQWRGLAGDLAGLPPPAVLAAMLAAVAPVIVLALYPPTGFDALLYHLPAAARCAASGRLSVAPELRFPVFPWLNEMLYAAALRLQDDIAAQLLEVTAYLGTMLLLWDMAARRWGAWAGALSAALWLGSPLAGWSAAVAYVEPLEALFMLATVEALWVAHEAETSRAMEPLPETAALAPRMRMLAGALAGCAAAVKYQGLFAVLLVVLASSSGARLAARTRRGGVAGAADAVLARYRRPELSPLLAAAVIALPWYIWIGVTTGDPLFPMLARLRHPPLPGVPAALLWPYPPPSPWLWLLAPLPLLVWRQFRSAGQIAAIGWALALVTAATRPDGRIVAVAGPLIAAGVAAIVVSWVRQRWDPARAAARLLAMVVLAILPGWLYLARLVVHHGAIPHDAADRDAYLRRELAGYGALAWLNQNYGRHYSVYGLWAENLRYYAAGRFIGDWYGPAPFPAAAHAAAQPASFGAFLAKSGADHLLVRRVPGQHELFPCDASGRSSAAIAAPVTAAAAPDDAAAAFPFLHLEYCDAAAGVWAIAPAPLMPGGR